MRSGADGRAIRRRGQRAKGHSSGGDAPPVSLRWFSPFRDLERILLRFNARRPSDAAAAHQLARLLRDEYVQRGGALWKKVAAQLTRRLRKRLVHAELLKIEICRDFDDHASRYGVSREQALKAWYEVWACLQYWQPDIPRRIGACPWCGSLTWRYRSANNFCSVCGLAPQILKGLEQKVADAFSDQITLINAVRRSSEQQFGELDAFAREYYGKVRSLLLMPVLSPVAAPIALPAHLADPHAFLVVWAFVFDGAQKMLSRAFQCPECRRVAAKTDLRMKYCSQACRIRASRRVSARPRSPSIHDHEGD